MEPNEAGFLRPLESIAIYSSQQLIGEAPWPIHWINLAGHILYAALVYAISIRLNIGVFKAALAGTITLVNQQAVYPLGNIDTLSLIFSSLSGLASIWLIFLFYEHDFRRVRHFAASLLCLLIGLLFKEGAAGYLPLVFLTIMIQLTRHSPHQFSFWKLFWQAVLAFTPFVIIFLMYFFAYRSQIVVEPPGSDRYSLSLGLNVLTNIALSLSALLMQFSTFDVYTSLYQRDTFEMAVYTVSTGIFWTAVLLGLLRAGTRRTLFLSVALLLFAIIVVGPTLLTQRVGELYIYAAYPFLCIVIAVGLGTLVRDQSARLRLFGVALTVFLFATNFLAISSKTAHMKAESLTSSAFYVGIENLLPTLDPDMEIVVIDETEDAPPYYSAFNRPTRSMVGNASNFLQRMHPHSLPQIRLTTRVGADSESLIARDRTVLVLNLTQDQLLRCADPWHRNDCYDVARIR